MTENINITTNLETQPMENGVTELKLQKLEPLGVVKLSANRIQSLDPNYPKNLLGVHVGDSSTVDNLIELLDDSELIDFEYSKELSTPETITVAIEANTKELELRTFVDIIVEYFKEADVEVIKENERKSEINEQVYVEMKKAITELGFTLPAKLEKIEGQRPRITAILPEQLEEQIVVNYPTTLLFESAVIKFKSSLINTAKEIIKEQELTWIRENPYDVLNQINSRYGNAEHLTAQNTNSIVLSQLRDRLYDTTKEGRITTTLRSYNTTGNVIDLIRGFESVKAEFETCENLNSRLVVSAIDKVLGSVTYLADGQINPNPIQATVNSLFIFKGTNILNKLSDEVVLLDIYRLDEVIKAINTGNYQTNYVSSNLEDDDWEDDYNAEDWEDEDDDERL